MTFHAPYPEDGLACTCVCVCVYERERERAREGDREIERESVAPYAPVQSRLYADGTTSHKPSTLNPES